MPIQIIAYSCGHVKITGAISTQGHGGVVRLTPTDMDGDPIHFDDADADLKAHEDRCEDCREKEKRDGASKVKRGANSKD